MSLPLPALLTQLRASYPVASLLSELLAIESNVFVVRASVQIGSVTFATGMAAAADIEAAEDRAKCRAIEALLLPATVSAPAIPAPDISIEPAVSPNFRNADPTPPVSSPVISPLTPLAKQAPSPTKLEPQLDSSAPDALTDWDNPTQMARSTIPKEPSLTTNLDIDFDLNSLLQENTPAPLDASPEEPSVPAAADLFTAVTSDPATPIDPPVNLADLNLTKLTLPKTDSPEGGTASPQPDAGVDKPTRRKSTAPPVEPVEPAPIAPPAEIDRSGEIARIGVEMKRLGWDTKKGRDHLQKTYGKRSRQELNDDELMDFLRYLEVQPSSAQMPF
ncbi:hypothetical protein [Leptolyngbya ohadii]|uniref:hypothetical protein n=1 Tax=Leptolyngbya ohadii TaxID=1962290 RepID=UPI000B5A2205|nr:hypothetical protein [Leptolyngbya ohadii]